mmetsp:Transcript_38982/g.72540  ORF Transcript_38982/g.72540 Transcript_38982/m.72540 type:complete len:292 (+) Transcript_38982:21-896(+)
MAIAGDAYARPDGSGQFALYRADIPISSLGLKGDKEVRRIFRRAVRDAGPASQLFGWRIEELCELEPSDEHVGYTGEDGTIFIKARDPRSGQLYSYSFILATLLHELTHLSFEGHGKAFYRRLVEAFSACGAEAPIRREVHMHVCSELLNAVCENDARRAKALLTVLPEAARCRPHGGQFPLEYAAHHGRVALTKLLLQARADPNVCSGEVGAPPLARAAAQGNAKTIRVLLEAGASRGLSFLPPDLRQSACDSKKGKTLSKEAHRALSLPFLSKGEERGKLAFGAASLAL